MKRIVGMLFVSCCFVLGGTIKSSAENSFGKELFGDLFKEATDAIVGGAKKEIEKIASKREQESKSIKEKGYCQIWSITSLSLQEKCEHKYYCNDNNICSHEYKWSRNGGISKVSTEDGVPITLNGFKTDVALVGRDDCILDGADDVFCFTIRKQSNTLVVRRSDEQNSQPVITPVSQPAEGTISELDLTQTIEEAPLPGTASAEPVASVPATNTKLVITKSEPEELQSPTEQPTISTAATAILNQFVAGIDNPSDEKAKAKRCALGPLLLSEFKENLDSATKKQIYGQLLDDGCA